MTVWPNVNPGIVLEIEEQSKHLHNDKKNCQDMHTEFWVHWTVWSVSTVAMYQQSCEEYKYQGKSSGSYWIDPDGSGSIAPFRVNCDMAGKMPLWEQPVSFSYVILGNIAGIYCIS